MISISQSYRLAKYFPDEAGHLPVPANLLLSEMDIPFYTWPVCFLTFSLSFHTLESYHQASDCTENDNSQMFCQEVSSVLLSDRSGNDMLCSILFLSLSFNVLTDHFYWSACYWYFISIDKFTKFCPRLRTEHYMHMINVMILLYHRSYCRTNVLFVLAQFISNLQRKENFCYIMLKSAIFFCYKKDGTFDL